MTDLVTVDEARARADRIRAGFLAVADWLADVRGAYAARDWVALGYDSWHEYLAGEYDNQRVALPVEERREAVAVMTRAGMSTRAIAPVLGISDETVRRDRQAAPTATNVAVENDQPAPAPRVQSLDGRSRPAAQPRRWPVDPAPFVENRVEPQIVAPATDNQPDDAELFRQLDERMDETAARFRALFSAAMAKADDVMQFDRDRIAEVVDRDALAVYVGMWRRWCEDMDQRTKPGLRAVGSTR